MTHIVPMLNGVKTAIIFMMLTFTSLFTVVQAQTPTLETLQKASLIFDAEIVSVGTSIMAAVPASDTTAVAQVQNVIKKPAAVSLSVGQQVVVLYPQPPNVTKGSRVRIFGNGRIFAETIAVEIVNDSQSSTGAVREATANVGTDEEEELSVLRNQAAAEALRARIAAASVVVLGRVREVRVPLTGALAQKTEAFISEHNPNWREAIIDVEERLKGAENWDSLVVRFPASEDVMWFDHPKLKVNERGTFILEEDTLTDAATTTLEGARMPVYTMVEKTGPLPVEEVEQVRQLIK